MCIDVNHNLYIFGSNENGQLGLENYDEVLTPLKHPSLEYILDVSAKGKHTFIKTFSNEVYAFGKNTHSQLGIKTENPNISR